ncbi:MAG: hypothetical protein QXK47_01090 [Candidatus Bathyarchaeia archaeon]
MKKKALVFLTAYLVAALFPASLLRFASVKAHSGVVLSAWTWEAPAIDGTIGEDEWSAAAKIEFNITTSDHIYNGTLYVMNDYENLYLAAKITDDDFGTDESTYDVFAFFFNNDHDGWPPPEHGDDGLVCWSISGRPFDVFFYNDTVGWPSDADYGGEQNGEAAASGDGTYNYFEVAHPLDSDDDAHDFSLKFRDTIEFLVAYADNGSSLAGFWPPLGSALPDIKVAAPFYQGDLVLSDDDVYIINGEFNINGSIIVTENATLVLKDAAVTFTQTTNFQFNITLKDAVDGRPRLIVDNATIDAGGFIAIMLYENSTAQINQLKVAVATCLWLELSDISSAIVENSAFLGIMLYGSSSINLGHSTVGVAHVYSAEGINIIGSSLFELFAYLNSTVEVKDSTITCLTIHSSTRQTLISELEPSTFSYWNYLENCSVILESGGYAPNVTLHNTHVGNWTLYFTDSQHTIIYFSKLHELRLIGSSKAAVYDTYVYKVWLAGSSRLNATDSKAHEAHLSGSSIIWSVNSTGEVVQVSGQAAIYVNWYLDVYVKDSLGQDVPYANVTVTCADGTVTAKGKTNMYGWVRLTALASIINATGEFQQWPHNVSATYEIYENSTIVNVNGNRQVTVVLSEFIVPEFSALLPSMAVLVAATSATAMLSKGKNARKKH